MALLALLLAVSALPLWVIFPLGYYPSRLLWVEIPNWIGISLTIAVLLHLILHWQWLTEMTRRYLNRDRNTRHVKY